MVGTLVSRDLFLEVGGFEDYPHGFEDWSLWAKCWKAGAKIIQVRRAVYIAHVDPTFQAPQDVARQGTSGGVARARAEGVVSGMSDLNWGFICGVLVSAGIMVGASRLRLVDVHPVKIHTVFITYNRLELTKQAIESYLETVTVPYTYMVVDNASEDGTKEWLNTWDHPYHALTSQPLSRLRLQPGLGESSRGRHSPPPRRQRLRLPPRLV